MEEIYFKLVIIIMVFKAHFTAVDGIHCYVCQSVTLPECGSMFMLRETNTNYIARCPTSCFKFVAAKGDYQAVSRGCLPEIKTPPRCEWDRDGDIHGSMCICNTDHCNVTSALRAAPLSIVTLLTVLIKILMQEVF